MNHAKIPSHTHNPGLLVQHRQHHHISGYNLFVSAYHGFAQLGREHVPIPQPYLIDELTGYRNNWQRLPH